MKHKVFVCTVHAHSADARSWFLLFFPIFLYFSLFFAANVGQNPTTNEHISSILNVFLLFFPIGKYNSNLSPVHVNYRVVTI